MSDLEHQAPEQLENTIARAEAYKTHLEREIDELEDKCYLLCKPYRETISKKRSLLGGNDVKLKWAHHYYENKTKTEMTLEQIEQALWLKIKLVES